MGADHRRSRRGRQSESEHQLVHTIRHQSVHYAYRHVRSLEREAHYHQIQEHDDALQLLALLNRSLCNIQNELNFAASTRKMATRSWRENDTLEQ